jgi:hypothetical protein
MELFGLFFIIFLIEFGMKHAAVSFHILESYCCHLQGYSKPEDGSRVFLRMVYVHQYDHRLS